jgi:cytochrome c-type biogenesis protein CcmH
VRVELDPALADRVSPDQPVFVFARAVDGPRMPVAAARLTVAELPADIRLTDAMAMDPGTPLSAFERVLVVARVAIGGRPTASSGDLEGVSGPVPVTSTSAVSVSISRVLE